MNIPDLIMGTNRFGGDKEKTIALLSGLGMFSPVIVVKEHLEHLKSATTPRTRPGMVDELEVHTYFPVRNGFPARKGLVKSAGKVIPVNSKNVLNNHKIIKTREFDFSQLPDIVKYLRKNGAITFLIEDAGGSINFLDHMKEFRSLYPYTTVMNTNLGPASPKLNEPMTLYITLYDLRYVIPVFSKRRADGFGVATGLFWPETSLASGKMHAFCELYFVCNKFKENVLTVDATGINESGFVKNDYIEHMVGAIKRRNKKARGKAPVPTEKIKIPELKMAKEDMAGLTLSSEEKYEEVSMADLEKRVVRLKGRPGGKIKFKATRYNGNYHKMQS